MKIDLQPIGTVRGPRTEATDDFWGGHEARIMLADHLPGEALAGLDAFSHVEVIYHFHGVDPARIVTGARHPRNNPAWPAIGIFAQRGKNRPNRIGSTICRVLRIEDRTLYVAELDAIDGTPVLDLKPYIPMFDRVESPRVPDWVGIVMDGYF